jgi:hypothetical protein
MTTQTERLAALARHLHAHAAVVRASEQATRPDQPARIGKLRARVGRRPDSQADGSQPRPVLHD